MLMQKLLPAIRSIAGDMFVFQQDSAPAHRARDTVELLLRETPQFISADMWPANSPDLNMVDNRVRGIVLVTQSSFCTVRHPSSSVLTCGQPSPDPSPVDNRVRGMLQQRVYRVPIHDTDKLRNHLVATRADFQQSVTDDAVDQWRKKTKHVSMHKVVTLNTCCDVACLTFQLPHITTGSFHRHQCLEGCNITFSRMIKFSILQGSAMTFFRCGG